MTDTQTIRLSDPAGVVAAAPYLLGFQPPIGSLVLIGLADNRGVGCTLRADLDPSQAEAIGRSVAPLLRRNNVVRVLALLYTAEEPAFGVQPPQLAQALIATGVDVADRIQVGPTTFLSLTCGNPLCCAPAPLPTAHEVAVGMVYAGLSVVPDRQDVEPEPAVAPGRDWRTASLGALDPLPPQDTFTLWDGGRTVLDPRQTGQVVRAWLDSTHTRDACIAAALGMEQASAMLHPGNEAPYADFLANLPPQQAWQAQEPLRRLLPLLGDIDTRSVVNGALAFVLWLSGEGTRAVIVAERAVDNNLARLVLMSVDAGIPPFFLQTH